ncbi:MAG: hypothetical protein ACK2T7_07000 [Anaerolineales bacterium]
MKLTPPTKNVFWISAIVALLGVVAYFFPAVNPYAVFIVLVGYILLFLGNAMKGF